LQRSRSHGWKSSSVLIVCHGETTPDLMQDAILSLAKPRKVVTMDELWWEAAADINLPRYFFKAKLNMMQFVLGKSATALIAKDHNPDTWSMEASLHTMGLNIWPVFHKEV
jgi:hypothetical protein